MTRIRTFRILLCLLLLSCCLPKVACHRRDRRRRGKESVNGVTQFPRRLQGNDKDATPSPTTKPGNDKDATPSPTTKPGNNNDANPLPTIMPIVVPTTAPSPSPRTASPSLSTSAPTLVPTTAPSPSPTTASPSLSPIAPIVAPTSPVGSTNSPTFQVVEDSVGNLVMRLYVVDDTTSASSVNEGRSSDLLHGVTAGLLEVECQVGLNMVLEKNVDGTSVCDSARRRRLQREDDSVAWSHARVTVADKETKNGVKYMDWTVVFSVLQIGAYYGNVSSADEALLAIQAETGTALVEYIQGGFMDTKLPDAAMSYATDQDIEDDAGYFSDYLDAHPFHALRMTGVGLFFVTLLLTFILFKISSGRKLERETDAALAKNKLGGLVTEEGLDLMLDTGRQESLEVGLRNQSLTEQMLVASRSNIQANGNGNRDGNYDDNDYDYDEDDKVGLWYLPTVLSPSKKNTPQAKPIADKEGHEDAGLDPCDSNLNIAQSFEDLGEGVEESFKGFFANLFSESPEKAKSKK